MKYPKPTGYRAILGSSTKTLKGEKIGILTAICYMAPYDTSGHGNVCPLSSIGCRNLCLGRNSGRMVMSPVQKAQNDKTNLYFNQRDLFDDCLRHDIARHERKANKLGMVSAVRINGTSDLPKLARSMADEFPRTKFYDYTKIPKAWQRTSTNYDLTFSHSENNNTDCIEALAHGINVAVVFGGIIPETWNGYAVHSGDDTDARFLDPKGPTGVVISLTPKGKKARNDTSGFVIFPENHLTMAAGM